MKRTLILICCTFFVVLSYAQNVSNPKQPKDNGWWCAVEGHAGAVFFRPQAYEGLFGISFTNGYRFSEYARLGVGFGVTATKYDEEFLNRYEFPYKLQGATLPLFLNVRGNILSQKERKCVPFWNADIGFAFLKNLFFFDAGIGMRVGGNRHAFVLSANYIGRMVDVHYRKESNFSNGIMFKLGYEF